MRAQPYLIGEFSLGPPPAEMERVIPSLEGVDTDLAELTVKTVSLDKIFYQPGQTIILHVEVTNSSGAPATADLKVELVHDLDTATVLSYAPITVAAGATQSFQFTTPARAWLGLEARISLVRNRQVISSHSAYFTCAANVHQVLMVGLGGFVGSAIPPAQLAATINYLMSIYRGSYGNYYEHFAWAPSDYDDMTPEADSWWAGQAQYNESKPNLLAMNRALAANGIQVMSYGKAAGAGPITYELLRQHPEYVAYAIGRPSLEIYDAAFVDFMETLGPPKPGDMRPVPGTPAEMEAAGYTGASFFAPFLTSGRMFCPVWYDSSNRHVIEHGCDEMGKSAQQLGFEGVRFDGEYIVYRHQLLDGSWNAPKRFDADLADASLVRTMKQQVREYKPGYLFGFNTHVDFRWNVAANNTPQAFREKCHGGGLIAREALAFPGNVPWMDYIKTVRHDSDLVRYYGGHMALYPFFRNPRFLYPYIIAYALRSHQMVGFVGEATQPGGVLKPDIARFATRHAEHLWDESIHAWARAGDALEVTADRSLWWEPFAAVRPLHGGQATQFIVHLINPPESPTTNGSMNDASATTVNADAMPAAPAHQVQVHWKRPVHFQRAYVADLDRGDLQPVVPLKDGADLVFDIPDVAHWSMLVIEANTPTPEAVWTLSDAEGGLELPSAGDLGLTPSDDGSWRQVMQAENYTSPDGTSDRYIELDAKGGASLHAEPGRPPTYMATGTYFFPFIPGHYKATFRLKVADNTSSLPVLSLYIAHFIENLPSGVQSLSTPEVIITGTDFARPHTYQDFVVTFQHPDIGFRGVACVYKGNNEVWWDQTVLELETPWTLAELEAYYAGFSKPVGLEYIPDSQLDVLQVRGLWNRLYGLDGAIAQLPGPVTNSAAYTAYYTITGLSLKGFNLDWTPLYGKDVLVLANVETRGLSYGHVKMIQQWVKEGGSLIVLGGLLTLGQGKNMERGWPDLLPIELNMPYEVQRCTPPVEFALPHPALGLNMQQWHNTPRVRYRHMVMAKPGSTVLLAGTDNEPLLVGGSYFNGKVVVFTGTTLGDVDPGQQAFWRAPEWSSILKAAIQWSRTP